MSSVEESASRDRFATVSTGRVEAFSDAVLAVAATLLVLDIKAPEDADGGSIWSVLAGQMPTLWPRT
jgi:uncharacterized membrane protein